MKYVVVRNEKESRRIQNKLFNLGYEWRTLRKSYNAGIWYFPTAIIMNSNKFLSYTYLKNLKSKHYKEIKFLDEIEV